MVVFDVESLALAVADHAMATALLVQRPVIIGREPVDLEDAVEARREPPLLALARDADASLHRGEELELSIETTACRRRSTPPTSYRSHSARLILRRRSTSGRGRIPCEIV